MEATAGALSVPTADLWVVGDGTQDILAARAAGAPSVAVLGGFTPEAKLRAASPDRIIDSLARLPALVEEKMKRGGE
jgi:phosphoglycolate phosphatase